MKNSICKLTTAYLLTSITTISHSYATTEQASLRLELFCQNIHSEPITPPTWLAAQYPNKQIDILPYDMRAWEQFLMQLNQVVANTQAEMVARQYLEQYIQHLGKQSFQQQVMQAYQPQLLAQGYKLQTFPTLVFKGKKIIALDSCDLNDLQPEDLQE